MEVKKDYRRRDFEQLRAQLENEASSFTAHWRDLGDHILPRRTRFTTTKTNDGNKANTKILDSTATMAVRTLKAGMMSGLTSPARPWFQLQTPDPELNKFEPVKAWLSTVSDRMRNVFIRSNLYNILPIIYGDLGVFGSGSVLMEEDSESVVKFYPFAIGSFKIAQDEKLKVNTFFREFRLSVSQVIEKFAIQDEKGTIVNRDNFSQHILDLYDNGTLQTWIDIYHFITPNRHYNPKAFFGPNSKKYTSIYYEKGSLNNQIQITNDDTALRISGFNYFPILAPRWEVTGEDVYGTDCPGMTTLGDIRQLQKGEAKTLKAIDKMIDPPMVGPSSLRNAKASILPGDFTILSSQDNPAAFREAHQVRFDLNAMEQKQAQVRQRISQGFFEDLFLMLSRSDRRQITAREIEERHEEKLLALGPVLEQFNQDFLDPLIDNTFEIMIKQGMIPEPPEELEGVDLRVEYVSIMAQAQKLIGVGSLERTVGFVSQMAQLNPESLDKLDVDQAIDIYSDLTGVPQGVIRTDEMVNGLRQQRAEQAAQEQQRQVEQEAIQGAKTLSETSTEGANALNDIAQLAGGEL